MTVLHSLRAVATTPAAPRASVPLLSQRVAALAVFRAHSLDVGLGIQAEWGWALRWVAGREEAVLSSTGCRRSHASQGPARSSLSTTQAASLGAKPIHRGGGSQDDIWETNPLAGSPLTSRSAQSRNPSTVDFPGPGADKLLYFKAMVNWIFVWLYSPKHLNWYPQFISSDLHDNPVRRCFDSHFTNSEWLTCCWLVRDRSLVEWIWGSNSGVPVLGPLCPGCFLICKMNIVLTKKKTNPFSPKVDTGSWIK